MRFSTTTIHFPIMEIRKENKEVIPLQSPVRKRQLIPKANDGNHNTLSFTNFSFYFTSFSTYDRVTLEQSFTYKNVIALS